MEAELENLRVERMKQFPRFIQSLQEEALFIGQKLMRSPKEETKLKNFILGSKFSHFCDYLQISNTFLCSCSCGNQRIHAAGGVCCQKVKKVPRILRIPFRDNSMTCSQAGHQKRMLGLGTS